MAAQPKITYCLWFDPAVSGPEEAARFYTGVFTNAQETSVFDSPVDTPSGKAGTQLTANFDLYGQQFMILNGGPQFKLNPSISFMVHGDSAEEIETLWQKLSEGGKALMPLDKYPFSDKYGWIQDKYGVSWQLILPQQKAPQKLMPSMMFVNEVCGRAEEAIQYYTAVFHDTKTGTLARYPAGMPARESPGAGGEPDQEGTLMYADFMLEGQWFAAMDSAHKPQFQFDEAISLVVHCETQDEVDYYWDKLTADGKEVQCGWLRDKFGVAWQIVPNALMRLMGGEDKERAKRVMQAMMQMVKLDIATLEQA